MNSTTKRIVVAFRLAGEPGRRKLDGFLRYISENRLDWQMQFVRIREDFNAEFVKSFAERGVDGVVYSLPNGFKVAMYKTRGKGYDLPKLHAWLEKLPRPAGVFTAYDDRAIQVLEACRDASIDVPHEIAVIGVDNDETLCPHTTPPLTSVQPDHAQIGRLAAAKLKEMLDGRRLERPEHILVGIKRIEVRESTSPVTPSGRLVQRALANIRAHYAEPLRPRDVVRELKVSRRLTDLRFTEIQGESIGKAILRTRLEAICRRLVTTNDTMDNIASSCGFPKLDRLRAAFKGKYGMTMPEYRSHAKAGR